MKHLRNFCIIAHIDHGKSTLADRMLEATSTLTQREMMNQVLDSMDLEREKGITIKSHAIQMHYQKDGETYTLNLIDTPGHVDFSYEVSRAISSCEGALLVVDAAQGIEAQTISNLYLALEHDLEIIPVLNKIDLPSARIEEVSDEIIEMIGCEREDIIHASAKNGIGITDILDRIIDEIPAPQGEPEAPLKALVFDSVFNPYRGTIVYFRIFDGVLKHKDRIRFMATGGEFQVDEVGVLQLKQQPMPEIETGSVGYMVAGIKNLQDVKAGDTITLSERPADEPVKGFQEVKPMVFAGIYPVDKEDFEPLRDSLEKLKLNDASLVFQPESSAALGYGFRAGFLGMLHMEIIQERLEREFNMTVITTVPNVGYRAVLTDEEVIAINSPSDLPDNTRISELHEPYIRAQIITKGDFIGKVMELCMEKRGEFINQVYLTTDRVELTFELPLAEVVFDFFDKLKTISRGYASFDYEVIGFRASKLVKMDILLNGDQVDALSSLIHRDKAFDFGKAICRKLKELIPRQQYEVAIQAAVGTKIIARETVKAMRKDVTAKCYGGDISRKRKLLEKQKAGKKRMRQVGSVEVPQSAFHAVLKLD
ncbi:translation elongation factor 4 [Pontibacter sp. G13]|uniref:translation elongation factor 4 n=1 Tax=Pontibacter sp. G13 TaxID=3074898 RepID=UPI0028894822|nr:translation elongation factor 4 [Pontibacter sp. G13]WNJ19205.1 translation elongation factor 4 [Pontibacter sp. G13]